MRRPAGLPRHAVRCRAWPGISVLRCRWPAPWGSEYHPGMSSAQPLRLTAGLLPLPRPLMTGEVLDAAFRLFRAGLLRTLPYSGLAVLVLELPTLYWDFILPGKHDIRFQSLGYLLVLALSAALLGVITMRLHAISRGLRPRFRGELTTVLRRWLPALIATIGAVGLPVLLFGAASAFNNVMPTAALMVL